MSWQEIAEQNRADVPPQTQPEDYYTLTRRAAELVMSGQQIPPELNRAICAAAEREGFGAD
jgi:hypothetical protein